MTWQPIEKYKGGNALFYFKRKDDARNPLPATVQLTRAFGYRECTMFLPFDMPTEAS